MVRINLLNPKQLADQHLIAEYNEILMLLGYVKKYPVLRNQPSEYCLGKGHIIFFKDKIGYLKQRHDEIRKEMKKRGFKTDKIVSLGSYPIKYRNDWKPSNNDFYIIKERILDKIEKKQNYYRYFGEKKSYGFFRDLMDNI